MDLINSVQLLMQRFTIIQIKESRYDWIRLHGDKLHNSHSTKNEMVGHTLHTRGACKVLVRKPERKRSPGRQWFFLAR
jgi:hypothetical protein